MARRKKNEKEEKKVKTKTKEKAAKKVEEKVEKTVEKKEKVRTQRAKKDTGSVDFQIKNFSGKITTLTKHLQEHPHDFDSRRGLLIMVGKRRRLLNYVKKSEPERYEKIIANLKLKK